MLTVKEVTRVHVYRQSTTDNPVSTKKLDQDLKHFKRETIETSQKYGISIPWYDEIRLHNLNILYLMKEVSFIYRKISVCIYVCS